MIKLKLNPDNPRYIKKDDFERLKWKIKTLPIMLEWRPIVYDENMTIRGGNMRYLALKDLEKEGFEVKDKYFASAKDLTEEQYRQFMIWDNLTDGGWDYDILANRWSDVPLEKWGMNLNIWEPRNDKTQPILETVLLTSLKPHPKKYREHPDDQINHIVESIKQNGFYENLLIAKDGTILDGHARVIAAEKAGLKKVPAMRLNIDPLSDEALKIMASRNEMSRFAISNDRQLTDILKALKDKDPNALVGTGFDDMKLANLSMVSRTAEEIGNFNEAAEWVGMPEFEKFKDILKIHVSFENEEARKEFMKLIGATVINKIIGKIWCVWYPEKARDDVKSIKFE